MIKKPLFQALLICALCIVLTALIGVSNALLEPIAMASQTKSFAGHGAAVLPGTFTLSSPTGHGGMTVSAARDKDLRLLGYCVLVPPSDKYADKYNMYFGISTSLTVTGVVFLPSQQPYSLMKSPFPSGDIERLLSNKPIKKEHIDVFMRKTGPSGKSFVDALESALEAVRELQNRPK